MAILNFIPLLFLAFLNVELSLADPFNNGTNPQNYSLSTFNESRHDYYEGFNYTPPAYTKDFLDHLDAIEIEYLEYFSQLSPVGEPPIEVSPCLKNGGPSKRGFGFKIPIDKFKKEVRKLKGLLNHEINRFFGKPPRLPFFPKFCTITTISINVYYHIVSSSFDGFSNVRPELLDAQHAYLNEIYAHLNIQFVIQDVNYRINPDFANHKKNYNHPHRRNTHSGNYWDLNVWIVESSWSVDQNGNARDLNGYGAFPNALLNDYERSFDGVVIRAGTMLTTDSANRKTLPHEIGHWLGLYHVFAEDAANSNKATCTNSNTDEVFDTLQFPNFDTMWDREQTPCEGDSAILVTNFMSYSRARGEDGIGFTTGQKSRAFSRYLGERLGLKNQKNCIGLPPVSTKRSLPENVLDLLKEDDISCLADWTHWPAVDFSSLPSPDPKYPQYPVIVGPRNPEPVVDPNHPPAGSGNCPNPDTTGTPPVVVPIPGTCPKPCNVHANTCHRPSAQTCIYPDPFVTNPRAACACRPGYRAAAPVDDVASHWRLQVPGLEDFVWVAEGVECNTRCDGDPGTPDCREVTALAKECLSN